VHFSPTIWGLMLYVFPSGPAETNAYLLACPATRRGVVIDVPFDSAQRLLDCALKHQITIEKILLTHSHWDHIAEVVLLQRKAGDLPVFVHSKDAENVKSPGSDRLPLLFPIPGVEPDFLLEEGQEVILGELHIKVIHTPGHTPGGVCFYLEKEQMLFSGDTLFKGTIGNLSFPTSSPDQMWSSLKRLALLPKETRVYPGHGESTTIGRESWIINAQQRFK